MDLYPLKFKPILKEKIWGGQKLKSILNKPSQSINVGESWEISDVDDNISEVVNGALKGKTLRELLEYYESELIGVENYKVFGNKFPLLIKFIDAKEDLSIQLHPNDDLAAQRHNSFGKTEMWYVMQADDAAKLIIGFNRKMTPELYLKHLKEHSLPEILNMNEVQEGDTFFIEVGRIHAIGAGVLLAEIQQTSDITYRVYDWDRVDDQGNSRELHNDLAIEAIDFEMENDYEVNYDKTPDQSNLMVNCPYFTTNYIEVTRQLEKENNLDSFIIYMCVGGEAEIKADETAVTIRKGETVLIPAAVHTFQITSDNARLLEVYV